METVRDPTEEEVLIALRRIARAASLHSRRIQHAYGLTSPQLFVLRELSRRGEATGGELARAACLSHATITGILDRLERRGLVRRTRSDQDRRRVTARVTAEGEALLETAPPPLHNRFLTRFRKLDDWERSFLLGALQRLASMMGGPELAEDEQAGPVPEMPWLPPAEQPEGA